jgi:hypothetical protein
MYVDKLRYVPTYAYIYIVRVMRSRHHNTSIPLWWCVNGGVKDQPHKHETTKWELGLDNSNLSVCLCLSVSLF